MRENLIHNLTLIDTAMYRAIGLTENQKKYKHEPKEFRSKLYEIYNKLESEDLEKLLKIKKQLL